MPGVADEPGVAEILRRAGLARGEPARHVGLARRAGGERLVHHGVHHRHVARLDDAAEALLLAGVERLAARGAHPFDDVRRRLETAIGERRQRRNQLQQRHLRSAERDRGVRFELGRDAEPVRGSDHRGRPELLGEPHRDGVERHRQRLLERDRPVVFAAVVFRLPALDRDRLVLAHRVRREAALDRGEVDERLERRARLPLGGDGAVELAFGVVSPADHGAHRAIRRHGYDGALRDAGLVAVLRKLVEQGLLGRRLQNGVDGRLDDDVLIDAPDQVVEHVHHPVGDVLRRTRAARPSWPAPAVSSRSWPPRR